MVSFNLQISIMAGTTENLVLAPDNNYHPCPEHSLVITQGIYGASRAPREEHPPNPTILVLQPQDSV